MLRTLLHTAPLFALMACGGDPAPAPVPVAPVNAPALVVGVANIEPLQRTLDLTAEAAGVVHQLRRQAGDTVRAGDTLIVLRNAAEQARVEQRRAALASQRATADAARADMNAAEADRDQAERELQRTTALQGADAATAQQLDERRAEAEKREAQLHAARSRMQESEARLREGEADLRTALAELGRTVVTAPADGLVLSVDVRIGSAATANGRLGTFAPAGPLMAITEVDELYADQVRTGDRAYIRPQGRTDTLSTGTVVFAAPSLSAKSLFSGQATDLEDRRVREVRVQLDRPDVLIGSRVECVILLGSNTR